MKKLIIVTTATIFSLLLAAGSGFAAMSGQEVYNQACGSCHNTGVANAPKLGDADTWSTRLDQGKEALYDSAINGKGSMPPKGGQSGLSDAEVKAAVDYILNKSK